MISGNRIYYDTRDGSLRHFSVKLNGKGLKKTNVIARTKYNASNKKGYKLIKKGMKVYLKTPKFKMYLGENNTVPLDAEY